MPPEDDQQVRFAVVTEMAALQWSSEPVLLLSHSNDTWLVDDPSRGRLVLRICWRGDRGRLITEAKIGRALPPAVGYPAVLGFGWTRDDHDLSWSVTRRLEGTVLRDVWSDLSSDRQREAGRTVATMLQTLHRWRPSAALSDRLLSWPRSNRVDDIIGATINPLPLNRVRRLADHAALRSGVDAELVDAVLEWLTRHDRLAPDLDQPNLSVTHGDLHLSNVWWDGERVSGLLDLEWVRLASAYVDLSRIADNAATDRALGGTAHQSFLDSILSAYPALAVPELDDRLRYTQLAFLLRDLLIWPDAGDVDPPADRSADHPARLLAELLG